MSTRPGDLVNDVSSLVTLPDVYFRISRLIDDPNSSATDIAKAVNQDPAFTVRLLKVANSALYRFPSEVGTVSKAVSIIGTSQIRNLALSMSVANSFEGLPNDVVSMADFWRHSLFCALIARHLAKVARRCDPDALFTAGLLHDVGELVIYNRMPDEAREAIKRVVDSGDDLPVYQAERQVMEFDHAAVGGELARQWKLPAVLQDCIACHHDIAAATRHPREAAIVHIANSLALMAALDTLDPDAVTPIETLAWLQAGLEHDCIEPAVRDAQGAIVEIEQLFGAGN